MSDLIRRQIHDYIQSQINPYGKPFKGTAYELGLKIMDYIKNMSTVEPVRGEWVDGTDGCKHCSKCGAVADETMMQWNNLYFCYHCGADMRKKVGE